MIDFPSKEKAPSLIFSRRKRLMRISQIGQRKKRKNKYIFLPLKGRRSVTGKLGIMTPAGHKSVHFLHFTSFGRINNIFCSLLLGSHKKGAIFQPLLTSIPGGEGGTSPPLIGSGENPVALRAWAGEYGGNKWGWDGKGSKNTPFTTFKNPLLLHTLTQDFSCSFVLHDGRLGRPPFHDVPLGRGLNGRRRLRWEDIRRTGRVSGFKKRLEYYLSNFKVNDFFILL